MDVELTRLPGVGLQYVFTTASGHRVGVLTHHTGGRRDLMHGPDTDPDRMCSFTLTPTDARTLARLLNMPDVVDMTVIEPAGNGPSSRSAS